MKRFLFLFLFLSVQLQGDSSNNDKIQFESDVLPLLENYCYRCHGDGARKGKVSLDFEVSGQGLVKDVGLWKRVWENCLLYTSDAADE